MLEWLRRGDLDHLVREGGPFAHLATKIVPERGLAGSFAFVLYPLEIRESSFTELFMIELEDPDSLPGKAFAAAGPVLASAARYGVTVGAVDVASIPFSDWRRLSTATLAWRGAAVAADLWVRRRDEALEAARHVYESIAEELDGQTSLSEPELEFLNNFGFIHLSVGDLEQAYGLLMRAAVRGGTSPSRHPGSVATLLCNLAAVTAGLGQLDESLAWSDQVLDGEDRDEKALVLIVFTPDPAWCSCPKTVDEPNPRLVAMATRASVLAMRADERAIELATDVVRKDPSRWSWEVAEAVGRARAGRLRQMGRRRAAGRGGPYASTLLSPNGSGRI